MTLWTTAPNILNTPTLFDSASNATPSLISPKPITFALREAYENLLSYRLEAGAVLTSPCLSNSSYSCWLMAESHFLATLIRAQTILHCLLLSELPDCAPRACWEAIWLSKARSSLGYYVSVVSIYCLSVSELTLLLGNTLNAFSFGGYLLLQHYWLRWSRYHSAL